MAGPVIVLQVAALPGRQPVPGAAERLHEMLVKHCIAWLEMHALQSDAMGWVEEYYSEAVAYAKREQMWGVDGDRLVYHFTDFTGLNQLGASAFAHWFELTLSLLDPYLQVLAEELGVRFSTRLPALDRIPTQAEALLELGKHFYWLEWPPVESKPILFSKEGVPRRTFESLDAKERETVERVAFTGACDCLGCGFVTPKFFAGGDPFGGSFDWGLKECEEAFAEDVVRARRELALGALLGAPWEGFQYSIWMATTYAVQGARDDAFRWLRRAVDDGFQELEELKSDRDLASLRGPELDAFVGAGPIGPRCRSWQANGSVLLARALLEGELARLARAAGSDLRGQGAYPNPLPTSFLLLLDELDSRDVRPPIDQLAFACQKLPPGERLAELATSLLLSVPVEFRLTVGPESVCGDGTILEADRVVGRLGREELSRLVLDARDARLAFFQTPRESQLRPPNPTGAPPRPDRVTLSFPGEASIEREVAPSDQVEVPTLVALWKHFHSSVTWARHRHSRGPKPLRSPIWNLAEQRERTLHALARAASGDAEGTTIWWHREPSQSVQTWNTLDSSHVRRREWQYEMPFWSSNPVGRVPGVEVVRIARALVEQGFPGCGVADADVFAVGRAPVGHVGLRVWAGFDVPVEVRFPGRALVDHPELAKLFERLDQARDKAAARPARPVRIEPVLPAETSKQAEPWTLPLQLLVLADFSGKRASVPLADVPALRVDEESFDSIRSRFPGGASEQVAVWDGVRALTSAARSAGRDDIVIRILDVGIEDLRDDFDDAPDLVSSGAYQHLLTEVPIDAVLVTEKLEPPDVQWLQKLQLALEQGPTQLFGRLPADTEGRDRLLVDADPFATGVALIRAFGEDPRFLEIENMDPEVTIAFRGGRIARHLTPLQLAASETHRSFARVERRCKAWLSSQTAFGRPMSECVLEETDDQLQSRSIEYTLRAKFAGGALGRVRFLLRLGTSLGDDPALEVLLAEALRAACRGEPVTYRVEFRDLFLAESGDVSLLGRWVGPASGESRHRLAEALLAALEKKTSGGRAGVRVALGERDVVLALPDSDPVLQRLAEVRASVRLPSLQLMVESRDAATLASLLGAVESDRIEWLTIGVNGHIGASGAATIASSTALGQLRELEIRGCNEIGSAGLAALAGSSRLPLLRRLSVPENAITGDGVMALANSELLARLEELDLTGNPEIYDPAVIALVSSANASKLKQLKLYATGIQTKGLRAIVDSPYLDQIECMELGGNSFNVDANDWVDQGAVIGHSPRDPEVDELLARFGARVRF